MKIDFGDPIDFEIPIAEFPISDVPIRLMANCAAIKVFVLQVAHDQMVKHVNQDKNIECGGVLVGYPFKDRESQEIFVVIAGIIPDASSDRSVVHFTVTPDTIARTREILEREFPELIAVGWYHSHPGHGVFLSDQDMTIVRGIYNEKWNVAWVIDPIRKFEGIFWGADGSPVISNIKEHALFEKNSKIWFSIEKTPQCILDLQARKITPGKGETELIAQKTIKKSEVVKTTRPYREEKNENKQLWGWVFFVSSMLTLFFLCVFSLIVPAFFAGAILVSIPLILIGFYTVLRFLSNNNKGNSDAHTGSLLVLITVFVLSFFWLFSFLISYMGILPPIIPTQTPTPTLTAAPTLIPTLTLTPTSTETPIPTLTPTPTELPTLVPGSTAIGSADG